MKHTPEGHRLGSPRHDAVPGPQRREPDLTLASMVGFFVGMLLIATMTFLAIRPSPAPAREEGLLSAVPGRATFEVAALSALRSLSEARPEGQPTAAGLEPWAGTYLDQGVVPARAVLAGHAAPVQVADVRDELVGALDRYVVTLGAAESCLEHDTAACRPQLTDLRDATEDVDRLSGDLRLFVFG